MYIDCGYNEAHYFWVRKSDIANLKRTGHFVLLALFVVLEAELLVQRVGRALFVLRGRASCACDIAKHYIAVTFERATI